MSPLPSMAFTSENHLYQVKNDQSMQCKKYGMLSFLGIASKQESRNAGNIISLLHCASTMDLNLFDHYRAGRDYHKLQVAPSPELLLHANQVVDAWSVLGLHPNLCVPRLAFITGEIGGRPSLFLAYDFYAAAITLEAAHMQPQVTPNGLVQVESVVFKWSRQAQSWLATRQTGLRS